MTTADSFKRGMRRLASGVSLVTTLDEGVPHGFAATSVTSVSAEPRPSLLVCVNKTASIHGHVHRSGILCVNVLNEGDAALVQRFSSPAHRTRRFEDYSWRPLVTGAPALVGALASFDCKVVEAMDVHSHTVFFAEVEDVQIWQEQIAPLIYVDGCLAGLRDRPPESSPVSGSARAAE